MSRPAARRYRNAPIGVQPALVVCIVGNIGPHTEFHDGNLTRELPEPNGYKHRR
jgi:hypothetical protein